jgi:plastocyanin
MKSAVIWIVGLLIVIAGGYWYWTNYYQTPASETANNTEQGTDVSNSNTQTGENSSEGGGVNVGVDVGVDSSPTTATVTLTSSGFTPKSVTIKKGGTITFKNESSGNMWVASAQHPTHTVYSGTTLQDHCDDATDTSFDQCKNGSTYSFTFDKTGTWNYHNHSVNDQFGTVVVVE